MKKITKKYQVQNFIIKKKREFYKTNLKQKINEPRELWKTLKSIGLSSKLPPYFFSPTVIKNY